MKFLRQAQIQVNTDLDELAHVLEWFDQFNSPTISRPIWLQCQLALAEGFTNAVRHAHRDKPRETPIDIEVTVLSQALEIRIWDFGSVFNLKHLLETLPTEMDKEAEGGRGLKLIKRMADRVDYMRTTDDRNCLLIVKDYFDN